MTTRKIVILIVTIVAGLALLVVVVAGGIVGYVLYSIGNSDAATVAKNFLRNNERLKQDIGEVTDFGSLVTGSINVHNNDGNATLSIKVIGERKTVNATIELMYRQGQEWRVTGAYYRDDSGQVVDLLNAYDALIVIPLMLATS